jgi:hypothetical protein
MMVKSLPRLWIVTLLIAWCFDFLFWRKPVGISFAIFITLLVLGGVGLSLIEKRPPVWRSLILLLPLAFFTLGTFWRLEPFTSFVNVLLSLLSLAILAITYRSGGWMNYGLVDYARRLLRLVADAFSKPITVRKQEPVNPDSTEIAEEKPAADKSIWVRQRKKVLPVVRGLLLALPVLLLFGALLASADPIFAGGLDDFFQFLKIENLPENLLRLVYIVVIAYFLTGIYLHAFTTSSDEKLLGVEKPLLPRFLGFTEATIILGSVNLLFATFVGVQFRYFFGGQRNVNLAGYTYAEYARRGFTELVLVAFFSLLLVLALSAIARRATSRQRTAFSVLGAVLTILVGVILVSAYQRLLLYEAAYGFTRLRTYTHVFILWLGVLLGILLLLELIGKLRTFTLAAILVAIAFGITLNLLPMDGFIVRQNIQRAEQRAEQESELDSTYLLMLSLDATPDLWRLYQDEGIDAALHEQIGGVLACQAALNQADDRPWQGFHLARYQAVQLFESEAQELARYNARLNEYIWVVTVNGKTQECLMDAWMD